MSLMIGFCWVLLFDPNYYLYWCAGCFDDFSFMKIVDLCVVILYVILYALCYNTLTMAFGVLGVVILYGYGLKCYN